eukprot:3651536-Prorocentrum_lima.AAC.1
MNSTTGLQATLLQNILEDWQTGRFNQVLQVFLLRRVVIRMQWTSARLPAVRASSPLETTSDAKAADKWGIKRSVVPRDRLVLKEKTWFSAGSATGTGTTGKIVRTTRK